MCISGCATLKSTKTIIKAKFYTKLESSRSYFLKKTYFFLAYGRLLGRTAVVKPAVLLASVQHAALRRAGGLISSQLDATTGGHSSLRALACLWGEPLVLLGCRLLLEH